MTRGPAAVVAAAVAVAAACGGGQPAPRYGTGLEEAVAEALIPDDPDGVAVSCPEFDPPPAADAAAGPPPTVALACEAVVGGVPVAVEALISGQWVDVSADAFLVDVAGLEEAAADRLSADLGPTAVDCGPDPVLVSVPDATLVCHAYDKAGHPHPFVITVTSETGDWKLSLGRPSG